MGRAWRTRVPHSPPRLPTPGPGHVDVDVALRALKASTYHHACQLLQYSA
jgi:hypothetical protein